MDTFPRTNLLDARHCQHPRRCPGRFHVAAPHGENDLHLHQEPRCHGGVQPPHPPYDLATHPVSRKPQGQRGPFQPRHLALTTMKRAPQPGAVAGPSSCQPCCNATDAHPNVNHVQSNVIDVHLSGDIGSPSTSAATGCRSAAFADVARTGGAHLGAAGHAQRRVARHPSDRLEQLC